MVMYTISVVKICRLYVPISGIYNLLYDEREPDEDEYEEFIDSDGVLHPQVVLISQNKEYQPKIIKPDMDFRVVGRVMN